MRILKPIFVVLLLAGIIFAAYYFFLFPTINRANAQILHMIDPDSLIVRQDGVIKKVQLIGLDAPELTGPYFSSQCFESEAKKKAARFFNKDREIELTADEKLGDEDIYGRALRYVSLKESGSYNEYLLKEGLAKEFHPQGKEYEKQTLYTELATEAENSKVGIWDPTGCRGQF